MIRRKLAAVVLVAVVASGAACSAPCQTLGPIEGWNPASLGFVGLPTDFVPVEHYQLPDPTGNQCQTNVFLSSEGTLTEASTQLQDYFESQGMSVREGQTDDVLFTVTGSTGELETATWVRRFDRFSNVATGLPPIEHLRQRNDVLVVLSIGSWK